MGRRKENQIEKPCSRCGKSFEASPRRARARSGYHARCKVCEWETYPPDFDKIERRLLRRDLDEVRDEDYIRRLRLNTD